MIIKQAQYFYITIIVYHCLVWGSVQIVLFPLYIGASCRTRVTKHLSVQFKTLSEAEEALQIDYLTSGFNFGESQPSSTPQRPTAPIFDDPLSPIFQCLPFKGARPLTSSVGDLIKDYMSSFKCAMSSRLRSQLLNHLFKTVIIENEGHDFLKFVKTDFLASSLSALKTLFTHGKHNLIYDLSKCFEGEVPRMPLNQMPFGLLDYNIRFFAKGNTQMLGIEDHYVSWLVTMFSHFGHKWLCLHRGPAWQYEVAAGNSLSGAEDSVEEESGEEVDIIQRALQESSFCLSDTEWASETLDNVDPPAVGNTEIVHVSHLWTHASPNQQMDMEVGLMASDHMEKIHGIQPTGNCSRRNPGMHDPLKVSVKRLLKVSHLGVGG